MPEALVQMGGDEQRLDVCHVTTPMVGEEPVSLFAPPVRLRRTRSCQAPTTPSGLNRTMPMNIRPYQSNQVSVNAPRQVPARKNTAVPTHRSPEADEAAADEGHHHHQAGGVQAHHVGICALLRHGEEAARQAGDPRREMKTRNLYSQTL